MDNTLGYTQPPEGYQSKRGCEWITKKAADPSALKTKPKQAPVCLVPMPQDGPKPNRFENDSIFNVEAWQELLKMKSVQQDLSKVGRCGDMSSMLGVKKDEPIDKDVARSQLSPSMVLSDREFGWCKPFKTAEDEMTEERLHKELEKVGNTCMLRFKQFRKCMRKLDVDRSGEVDRVEFTCFFNTEFGVPERVGNQIFDLLNQPDETGHRDDFLDYNELMVVLGPYINPGAPPPVQLKAGNTAHGSVANIHLRKLG